jgi:hypothetical protein
VYAADESATSPTGGIEAIEELLTEAEVVATSLELELELEPSPQPASTIATTHVPKIRPVRPPALIPIGACPRMSRCSPKGSGDHADGEQRYDGCVANLTLAALPATPLSHRPNRI